MIKFATRRLLLIGRNHAVMSGLLLFVVSLAVSFLCMRRDVSVYDEGLILSGAQRIGNGDLIHRDFYANYGPAQFYILALLFKLFSPSVLVARVWDSVVRSAIVLLLVRFVSHAGSKPVAWIVALAGMAWLSFIGFYGYPSFPALAEALASGLCLLPVFAGSRSATRLATAGLCVGAVALFRYDVGFFVFGSETLVLCAFTLSRSKRIGGLIQVLLPFFAGLALVALPVAGAYLVENAIGDMLRDVVIFPARTYAVMRALPFPLLSALRSNPPEVVGTYLPILISAVALAAIIADVRRRHCDEPDFWMLVLLFALTLVFIANGYVRISALHMGMAIVTSLALLGVLSCTWRERGRVVRVATIGAILVTSYGTLTACRADLWREQENGAWLAQGADCGVPTGLERLRCFTVGRDAIAAMSYIQRVTTPGTAIFVGLGRHDKILVNDVAFYFLADRPSVTKWEQFDPGVQTTEPVQRAMVSELRTTAPAFVVLESTWDDAHEPNGSATSSGVTLLDDYIRAHFSPAAEFGPISVLKARAGSSPLAAADPRADHP